MKVSELIKELEDFLEEHGDLEVMDYDEDIGRHFPVKGVGLRQLIQNPFDGPFIRQDSAMILM